MENHISKSVNSSSKHRILPPDDVEINVYHRRWYILTVFVGLAFMQSMTWNTWGPIADTAISVFGWNQANIALLSNWGPIAYILTAFPFSWLLEEKGLRVSTIAASACLLIGVSLRCIPVPPAYTLWVMHPGQFFIGLSGPVLMAAPTSVSATWFPTKQRTTSTAIGAMAAILGVAGSFIVGPQLVHEIPVNGTTAVPPMSAEYEYDINITPAEIDIYLWEIRKFMYLEAGAAALFCLLAFLYFPAKPPLPPSTSASIQREKFFYGFKQLCRKWRFLTPAFAYAIPMGAYGGFTTELTLILKEAVNVSQDTAGWIGFYCNIAAVAGGLLFSSIVDLLGGRTMKKVLLLLTFGALCSCLWILLICMNYIDFHIVQCYASIITMGFLLQSMIPLFFEICAEGAYPIGEGTTTMFSTFLNNSFSLIFLLVALVKSLGTVWMTWAMLGAIVLVIPLLLIYKEQYNRLDVDTNSPENGQVNA